MSVNPPPGSPAGRLPVDLRPRRLILLPYNDLLIDQGMDQYLPIDPSGFRLGLVLPYGLGPNEPRVFQMDDTGNLKVTMPVGQPGSINIAQAGGTTLPAAGNLNADGAVGQGWFQVAAAPSLFNGGTWDRWRSASAADLAAQSGLGAAVVASPGEWSVFANGALGAASSASRVAGGAGVRHIGVGYSIIVTSQAAPGAGALTINLRDGATGAGTIVEQLVIQIPAALYAPIVIARSGLSIVGTAATAMTLESSAAYAAVGVSINLEGFDAT